MCFILSLAGAKIHLAGSKIRCIEDSGTSYTIEEGVGQVPETITSFYQHTLLVGFIYNTY